MNLELASRGHMRRHATRTPLETIAVQWHQLGRISHQLVLVLRANIGLTLAAHLSRCWEAQRQEKVLRAILSLGPRIVCLQTGDCLQPRHAHSPVCSLQSDHRTLYTAPLNYSALGFEAGRGLTPVSDPRSACLNTWEGFLSKVRTREWAALSSALPGTIGFFWRFLRRNASKEYPAAIATRLATPTMSHLTEREFTSSPVGFAVAIRSKRLLLWS